MRSFHKHLAAVFCLLFFQSSKAQVILDVKKDFGAVGNGKADDTKALRRAAEKVNQLKENVVLFIPKGVYLVHPQAVDPDLRTAAFRAVNILSFKNCTNIVIKGEKGTKIQFAGPLYYGSFRRTDKGVEKLERVTTDYKYRVAVGHGIELEKCRSILVQNLEMDGNNKNFVVGGEFGDVGIQIDNDGILIRDCSKVSLHDLSLHHFGRDGVMVMNQTPQGFKTASQDIQFLNCQFEYNGRQGFSWVGGVGLTATNCSFSYTGKSRFSSPPGAGVDFEPNAGYIVQDGLFVNCVAKSNAGVGVLADVGGFNVRNIKFMRSTIQGETSHALWIKSPSFTFADCAINGGFLFGCPATNAEEGTRFVQCTFDDRLSAAAPTKYLVESNGSRFLYFDKCVFRTSFKALFYVAADVAIPAHRAVFNSCRFVVKGNSVLKDRSQLGSVSTGVDYTGQMVTVDSSGSREGWNIANSRFVGTKGMKNNVEITNNFVLASYEEVIVGDNKEEVLLTISQNGALLINQGAKLTIGKKGRILLKKGGTLWIAPGAQFTIDGDVMVEQGAYLCINTGATMSAQSKKNIRFTGTAIHADNPQLKLGLGGCITW